MQIKELNTSERTVMKSDLKDKSEISHTDLRAFLR